MPTLLALALAGAALADPCGMVPPAWIPVAEGDPPVLQRQGDQITYAFFKDGVETMVLRPGFSGQVDEFGMLIPFPSPPSLRKTADETFTHLAAAVDAPVMNVNITYPPPPRPVRYRSRPSMSMAPSAAAPEMEPMEEPPLRFDEVRVVNQEAVGMYEVAVLQAGSSSALNAWMEDKDYRYPEGMDAVIDDYVAVGWAFVAIKAKVGQMPGVAPQPGMTGVNSSLPAGASFDGHVQGMGFRFEVDAPVIPMRLASFNDAAARNLVYFLSDDPLRIDGMDVALVKRQVSGTEVRANLEQMIPMEVTGGTLTKTELRSLDTRRDPTPYNKVAKDLIAADLAAVAGGDLVLEFETYEKQLLAVSERLGLRGPQIDGHIAAEVNSKRDQTLEYALADLDDMTLTVFDGDFDVTYMADKNLEFARWRMNSGKNDVANWTRRPAGPYAEVRRPWSQRPNKGDDNEVPEPYPYPIGYDWYY